MSPDVWVKLRTVPWPPLRALLAWSATHMKWRGYQKRSSEFIIELPLCSFERTPQNHEDNASLDG